jgi:hypothetical protein
VGLKPDFQARAASVGEHIGSTVARRSAKRLLHVQRQSIDTGDWQSDRNVGNVN